MTMEIIPVMMMMMMVIIVTFTIVINRWWWADQTWRFCRRRLIRSCKHRRHSARLPASLHSLTSSPASLSSWHFATAFSAINYRTLLKLNMVMLTEYW